MVETDNWDPEPSSYGIFTRAMLEIKIEMDIFCLSVRFSPLFKLPVLTCVVCPPNALIVQLCADHVAMLPNQDEGGEEKKCGHLWFRQSKVVDKQP